MTNEIILQIKSIVEAHHTQYGKFLRKPENKHLLEFIENYESEKLKDNNLQTKIYWILNDIHDYPKCHNPNCPNGGIVKSNVRNIFTGYGTEYPTCCSACAKHTPEYLQNWGDSIESKYGKGIRHPMHSSEVKTQVRETTEERWGGIGFASPELNAKERAIFKDKYGSEDPGNLPESREKARQTSIENWGVDNPMKNDDVKQKMFDKQFELYGGYWGGTKNRKIVKISKGEKEVLEYVRSIYNGTIIENDRTQMEPNNDNKWIENHELDIWLPDIRVAIEYNGTYWHSIPSIIESDKFKKIQCESKGIKLISISEQDWNNDRKTCESKICRIVNTP